MGHVPRRMQEIIVYEELMVEKTGRAARFFNLGQSLGRHSPSQSTLPAIIPNGVLYDATRKRAISGPELLHAQGMSLSMMPHARRFGHKLCADLAGNAFSAAAASAFVLATLSFIRWPARFSTLSVEEPDPKLDDKKRILHLINFSGFKLAGVHI